MALLPHSCERCEFLNVSPPTQIGLVNVAGHLGGLRHDPGPRRRCYPRRFARNTSNEVRSSIVARAKQGERCATKLAVTRSSGELAFQHFIGARRQNKIAQPVYAPDTVKDVAGVKFKRLGAKVLRWRLSSGCSCAKASKGNGGEGGAHGTLLWVKT